MQFSLNSGIELKKEKRHFDLHVHSNFSYDCRSDIKSIIDHARKKRLSGIAITDHNTIKGGLEASQYSNNDFMVIVGAEYSTEIGHILGLFLKDEISPSLNTRRIIQEIHNQEGIAILAHPFKYLSVIRPDLLEEFDAMEIFNSRAENLFWRGQNNKKALWLSQLLGVGFTAGSDAHFLYEIGRATWACVCELNEKEVRKAILEGSAEVCGVNTSPLAECSSQIVKSLKLKQSKIIFKAFCRTYLHFLFSLLLLPLPSRKTARSIYIEGQKNL